MEPLNYHHLRLFRAVASEGNLTRASAHLHLTPQTVSAQIRDFEAALGEELFSRVGRRMVLTDIGQIVLRYANDIFAVGKELQETLRGNPTGRSLQLIVGVADVLPKLIVHHLIQPALQVEKSVRVICREGTPEQLLADLCIHRLDVVLSDAPIPANLSVHAYNHHLGKCGVTFMARRDTALRLRKGFPHSLHGVPALLPTSGAVLRSQLDRWFETRDIQPLIVGEFEDSALLKAFGQAGVGVFAIPSVIKDEVARQYSVKPFGSTEEISENFYAISVERRLRHPGIVAICHAARSELFA